MNAESTEQGPDAGSRVAARASERVSAARLCVTLALGLVAVWWAAEYRPERHWPPEIVAIELGRRIHSKVAPEQLDVDGLDRALHHYGWSRQDVEALRTFMRAYWALLQEVAGDIQEEEVVAARSDPDWQARQARMNRRWAGVVAAFRTGDLETGRKAILAR